MRYSQNGWTVYESSAGLWPFQWVTGRVRGGSVFTVLDYLAKRFNDEVEPIDRRSSWGYANRAVRGSRSTSNHASGTAVDFNAPAHPLGKRGTFTASQRAAIRRILNDLDGCVRWGGDYSGRADEMHFEINASESDVSRVAARILGGAIEVSNPEQAVPTVTIPTPPGTLPLPLEEDDMYTDDDRARAVRIEEHVAAARQHAANAEANSHSARRMLEEHLFPTREHAAAAEANAYRAVRLLEQAQRDENGDVA